MLDLRELVASLDDEDKRLWTLHRTEMRRSYMTAHNSVLGIGNWTEHDDSFMDIIDIKLALLFDKSGRMSSSRTVVKPEDSSKIEADIEAELVSLKNKTQIKPSEASKAIGNIPTDGWGDAK